MQQFPWSPFILLRTSSYNCIYIPEFGNSTTKLTLTNLLHCKVEMMTFISIALSMVYKKPEFKVVAKSYTGCVRQNENPTKFKIVKEPLLVQKQTIHQQKVLDLGFNLTP